MLKNDLEQNGIYGYANSKEKKRIDAIKDSLPGKGGRESLEGFVPDSRLASVERTVERVGNLTDALGNKNERSAYHFNSAREALVPTDNEQRRRRQFVLSQNVADDAVNEFYKGKVLPEFNAQRERFDSIGNDTYRDYSSVPGADPLTALRMSRSASDPSKVINSTMERIDGKELNRIADAYARYGGLDTDSYRNAVLEPALSNRMVGEYIKDAVPGSGLEYVARSAWDNSLTGKLSNLSLDGLSPGNTRRLIDDEAKRRYNANRFENFAAGVGGLLIDTGIFAGIGGVVSKLTGKATSAIAGNLTSRVLAKGASRGLTGEAAKRIVDRTFINTLGTRIATSGSTQGLTLGAYDATNSVVDDILYGGKVDAGKAAGSFAKGFGTGMALGAVGTPLRMKASGLTGGKKVAASAGVLSAESAVFTLGAEAEKLASGVEIEPIDLLTDFGESTATLLAMRMAHWRPKGALEKLGRDGRLKPELDFNQVERQEMRQAGVNPDNFISSIEYVLKPNYPSLHGNARRDFISNYEGLISNDALSASTRAKLLYIVENKLTSTPPVPVEAKVEETDDGALLSVKDNAGRNVERLKFASRGEAEAFAEKNSGLLRRNRIASIEETFRQGVDSENFFRQAGEYSRETGIAADEISDIMYRKAKQQPLDSRQQQIIDDILYRSSYNDTELGNVMFDIRNNVEQRYGLGRGALLAAIEKNRSECTDAENRALGDYEAIIGRQAEKMRSGVTNDMHADARAIAERQPFEGYGNRQIRDYERAYNTSVDVRPSEPDLDMKKSYKALHPQEYEYARKYGIPYPADGEPSLPVNDPRNPMPTYLHSHDKLARMTVMANETAKRLNTDVELLYDPHQLSDGEDYYAHKLISKGWHDSGTDKITINLASNDNVEDTGFTVLHEYVGHKGLANLFGQNYVRFLGEMLKRATPEVRKKVRLCRVLNGLRNDYEAMDEYLALAAEKSDKTPAERGVIERFKDFLDDSFYRMRIPVRGMDDRKIAILMSQHRKALENNTAADKHRKGVFGSFRASHVDPSGEPYAALGENNFRGRGNSLLSQNRFRFIGEKGFNRLVERGVRGFIPEQLSIAKRMLKKGNYSHVIKSLTGWGVGSDGKMRYEIDDSNLNLEYYPEKRLRKEHPKYYEFYEDIISGDVLYKYSKDDAKKMTDKLNELLKQYTKERPKLYDMLSDDVFFKAYPEYKNVKVKFAEDLSRECIYDHQKKTLYVDKNSMGSYELNECLAGEMQKMIQYAEGFAMSYPVKELVSPEVYDIINEPIERAEMLQLVKEVNPKEYAVRRRNFHRKFGFFPEEVLTDDYSKEVFRLSALRRKPSAQMGDIEVINVMDRFDMSEYERLNSPIEYRPQNDWELEQYRKMAGEDPDTEFALEQLNYPTKEKFIKKLKGPIDYIKKHSPWKGSEPPKFNMMDLLKLSSDDGLPNN